MTRLQKKCYLTAAGLHLLLVVIILVGPAFLSSRDESKDMQLLDIIPSKAIDEAMQGGGSPDVPKPTELPKPAPAPQAEPPKPQQTLIERIIAPKPPEPVEPEDPKPEKPEPPKINTQTPRVAIPQDPGFTKPAKPQIQVNKERVIRTVKNPTRETTRDNSESDAQDDKRNRERQKRDFLNRLNQVADTINKNQSGGTEIKIPGPGGEAYANWGQIVTSIYNQEWRSPVQSSDEKPVVKTSVTVARDGSVISARITRPSGNAEMDASVREVLNRKKFLVALPAGSTDDQRTVTITFDLNTKR